MSYCSVIGNSATVRGKNYHHTNLAKENPSRFHLFSQIFVAFTDDLVIVIMLVRPAACIKSCTFKPESEPKQDVTKEKSICLKAINPCSCVSHLRETTSHRLHLYVSLMDHIQN